MITTLVRNFQKTLIVRTLTSVKQFRRIFISSGTANVNLIQKSSSKRLQTKNQYYWYTTQSEDVNSREKIISSTSVIEDGKKLQIEWNDKSTSRFHSIWLRHNCQCLQCVQPGTGQRIFDHVQISHQILLHSVIIKDGTVYLRWKGESDHQGEIPLRYLKENSYSTTDIIKRHSAVRITQLAKEIPVVNYVDVLNDKEALYRWLYNVNEYGLCLMKDVPTQDKTMLQLAEKIGPIQGTNYGQIFEVRSEPNPVNIAYSTVGLELHMDLVYLESPPGLQLLHCLRYDKAVIGGESTYLDIFHVVEKFRVSHPESFHILSQIPATFQKCHYERENPFHLVYQKPHITLNNYNEVVGVHWAPPFTGPLLVEEDDVLKYYKAFEDFSKAIRNSENLLMYHMEPGDLMTFNNHRMLHGRKEFHLNGGIRHLQGCYICIDDFKSKIQVLSNQVGDGRVPRHVCNQSWL